MVPWLAGQHARPDAHDGEQNRNGQMITLQVLGITGQVACFDIDSSWSVAQAKEAIAERLGIPEEEQVLVHGTAVLGDEVPLSAVALPPQDPQAKALGTLTLTMLRQSQQKVELGPGELRAAILRSDVGLCLELLGRPQLPGLNAIDRAGWSLLHLAVDKELSEVALAIVQHTGFTEINRSSTASATALHWAAAKGLADVCSAILTRPDFTELTSETLLGGKTARQVAMTHGYLEIAQVLREAERQPEAQRPEKSQPSKSSLSGRMAAILPSIF